MADQAAENIAYFSKEVLARINGFRATPKKERRVSYLKWRLEDLAYWAKYLVPLVNDLSSTIPSREHSRRTKGLDSMTTTRLYNCNLCRTQIKERGCESRAYPAGLGIVFQSSPNPPMRFTACSGAEHHICDGCAATIKELWA